MVPAVTCSSAPLALLRPVYFVVIVPNMARVSSTRVMDVMTWVVNGRFRRWPAMNGESGISPPMIR